MRTPRRCLVLVLCAATMAASCTRAPAPLAEVVAFRCAALPKDPGDVAWQGVRTYTAALLLQDLVEPRLTAPSTAVVRIQALTDGRSVAFRLEWQDATRNDTPRAAAFPDGCAVQLPASPAADLPAPQMGEPGREVEIAYWRASWQASVDGRADEIRSLFPNAHPDHYPFTADSLEPGSPDQREMALRYAPARALGNSMEGPRDGAVEDLIADGPGTLRPRGERISRGSGVRTASGWAVQIVRPLPGGVAAGDRSEVAFAVWDGALEETGARKMRTGWVPLLLGTTP